MHLTVCDALVGLPRVPYGKFTPNTQDLLAEMTRCGIRRAIVRHRSALEGGPDAGNKQVCAETDGQESLLPSWFLTPDGREPDFDPQSVVRSMLEADIRVAWTDPRTEEFSLLPWCSGPLYEVLGHFRVPLFLDCDGAPLDVVNTVLENFPDLRMVLLGAPRLGRHRLLYPLLRRHPSLMMGIGFNYSVHDGFEDLCRIFGPHRWVFATGYPEAEMGAGVAGLMYAAVDDADKEAIANGNIERILQEVAS